MIATSRMKTIQYIHFLYLQRQSSNGTFNDRLFVTKMSNLLLIELLLKCIPFHFEHIKNKNVLYDLRLLRESIEYFHVNDKHKKRFKKVDFSGFWHFVDHICYVIFKLECKTAPTYFNWDFFLLGLKVCTDFVSVVMVIFSD